MKKIILLSFIIITCISCKYEERGNLTQNGKEMFDTWQSGTQLVMDNVVRPIFLVNAWIASDSAGRIAIEDQYFPQYKIRQYSDNMFRVMDGARPILTITTNGQNSLGEAGTIWSITDQIAYTQTGEYVATSHPLFAFKQNAKHLTITNIGNNCFSIAGDTVSYFGSAINWELTFSPGEVSADIYATSFAMSGSGSFNLPGNGYNGYEDSEPKMVLLRYNIERPFAHYKSEKLVWESGKIHLTASMEGATDIEVDAEVAGREAVDITYRGVTERW